MVKEESLVKSLHKIFLLILKVIPLVNALGHLLNTLFAYYDIETPWISFTTGMSLTTWLFIYLATFVFKFCIYHRMFLYYIAVVDIIDTVDYYIGIPLSDYNFLVLHIIITGITLFIILYLYVKHHKKLTK